MYHLVCRTCATYGLHDCHESIEETLQDAESTKRYHLQGSPGHDVRIAEVA